MQLSLIQNHIISHLKNADKLRYSEIKPIGTPNDLYNYHLKALQGKGLVEKTADGYRLSHSGKRYVADVHHTSDQSNRLFKVNVITIVSRLVNGELQILNQERASQPSYGKIGVMGGTVVKGEPILQAATRKLQEETGLVANFRLLGHERRISYENDKLFSDILFPICYADASQGDLVDTVFGRNFWTPITSAIEHETNPHDSIVSILAVLQAIQQGSIDQLPLFYTETTQKRQS